MMTPGLSVVQLLEKKMKSLKRVSCSLIWHFIITENILLTSIEGQHCTVEKNNMNGKCLPLLECKSVMETLRIDITAIPTICDSELHTVCCPSISELSKLL